MNIDELAEKIAEDSDNPRIIEVWVRKGIVAGLRLAAEKVEQEGAKYIVDAYDKDQKIIFQYETEASVAVLNVHKAILSLIPKEASDAPT